MPRYEFYCEDYKQPFAILLTLAEHEQDKVKRPKCGGKHLQQEAAAFFAVTSKKKLKEPPSAKKCENCRITSPQPRSPQSACAIWAAKKVT
jgi:hypothetical protein